MIRQVRLTELYTDSSGTPNVPRTVFAFGTHPDATPAQEHPVTSALPGQLPPGVTNKLRVIVDELLVGNALEEIKCRGQVDDDEWASVPINSTPDDIAKCSVQADALPNSCSGPNAVCMCQRPTGCSVGTTMIDMGKPVGVVDDNQDGAADTMRFIDGAVGIQCGSIKVPINHSPNGGIPPSATPPGSYYEPSGNQQIPAAGGFDVLGPAIVLIPQGPLPTGATCGLTFSSTVVDKQGNQVCAPPDGDINQPCTPGDVSAFKFTVQILSLSVQGIAEGEMQVSTTDPINVLATAPLDPATVNNTTVTLVVTAGGTPVAITPNVLAPADTNIQIRPTATLTPNTMYTLTLTTGIHDTFGQSAAAPTILHFTTGP